MAEAKNTVKKEETVTIKLPRLGKSNPDVFVSVNERTWLIKRGVEVDVPACVAEVIRNSELMEQEAIDFDDSVKN